MQTGAKLRLYTLDDMMAEAKRNKLKEVRVATTYNSVPSSDHISITFFYVVVTALHNGSVMEYREEIAREIIVTPENRKEIAKTVEKRAKEIEKILKEKGYEILPGIWAYD